MNSTSAFGSTARCRTGSRRPSGPRRAFRREPPPQRSESGPLQQGDSLHVAGHREAVHDPERKCDPLRSPALMRPNELVTCGNAVWKAHGRRRPGAGDCESKRAQSEPNPSPPLDGRRRSQTSAASARDCRFDKGQSSSVRSFIRSPGRPKMLSLSAGAWPVLPNQCGTWVSNSAISPGPRTQSLSPRTRRICPDNT